MDASKWLCLASPFLLLLLFLLCYAYSSLFMYYRYELEAFLACWLSLYVFPGGPEKGVSPRFFHLAVRMARGERFALASFYLGSLYRCLDLFHETSVRSKRRYAIVSDVDLGFL